MVSGSTNRSGIAYFIGLNIADRRLLDPNFMTFRINKRLQCRLPQKQVATVPRDMQQGELEKPSTDGIFPTNPADTTILK